MKRQTAVVLNQAFHDAWDEFGDDKSTPFLISIVASRHDTNYETVIDALSYCNDHGLKASQEKI